MFVGAADEALRVKGVTRLPGDVPEHNRVVEGLEVALDPGHYRQLHGEGSRLPWMSR